MNKKLGSVADEVTRAALVLRLLSLLLVVLIPDTLTLGAVAGQMIVAGLSMYALSSPKVRVFVSQHPMVVVVDSALLAGVAFVSGAESPFVLTFMTSALLVGLWTRLWTGGLLVIELAVLYALVWSAQGGRPNAASLLIPVTFLMLWWLGYAVRQADQGERAARSALRSAITVAAASEERTRLAREMHDTLAKSLQAISLTATALPVLLQRNPDTAQECVNELKQLSVTAIADARALMSELRRAPDGRTLEELITQLCSDWGSRGHVVVRLAAGERVDVEDELVRYELLMVTAEALENVRRHARAGTVTVSMAEAGDRVSIEVADDGVGVPAGRRAQAERDGHYGLRGMAERMTLVGGTLELDSSPGGGTRVRFEAPRRGLIEVGASS